MEVYDILTQTKSELRTLKAREVLQVARKDWYKKLIALSHYAKLTAVFGNFNQIKRLMDEYNVVEAEVDYIIHGKKLAALREFKMRTGYDLLTCKEVIDKFQSDFNEITCRK